MALNFATKVDYSVNAAPTEVAVADINADGIVDIITSNNNATVSILLGMGDGTFSVASSASTSTAVKVNNALDLAVADVNGDNVQDILTVGNEFYGTHVSVLTNNGLGSFVTTMPEIYTINGSATAIAAGDFNADGFVDIVITEDDGFYRDRTSAIIYKNKGGGTFSAPIKVDLSGEPYDVITADVNKDGLTDIITTNYLNSSVSILKAKTDGTFETAIKANVGTNPKSVAAGDVNGDGKLDLVTANYTTKNISVLPGDGNGLFGIAPTFNLGAEPNVIVLGDLNQDGKLDMVTANSNKTVSIATGSGNGTFVTAMSADVGTNPSGLALKDVNNDGLLDIIVSNQGSENVSVLLNTSSGTTIVTNHPPTGSVLINGTPAQGQTLTATNSLADSDGLGVISYTWKSGTTVVGSGNSYKISASDVGKALTVTVSYTDGLGKLESVTSSPTAQVTASSGTTDTIAPYSLSFTPADNASAFSASANLQIVFSENIQKGTTGTITLKKLSDNSVVESMAVTSANLSISGNTLTINPTANLLSNTNYYVEISNGAIKDLAGNNYAGISGNSTWNFTTGGSSSTGKLQIVTPDFETTAGYQTSKAIRPGGSVDLWVGYSTSDNNNSIPSSFGFKLHYNSSQLTLTDLSEALSTPLQATIGSPQTDSANEDNNLSTDKFINVAWLNLNGAAWPNSSLPVTLYKATFFATANYTGTTINFSSADTSAGYGFSYTSANLSLAPAIGLDVDGNDTAQGSTDGILIARYLFGFTGTTLTNGAIGTGATRTSATEIQNYLANGKTTMLDVDGNGTAQGSTDGILIARYLFGFTGTTLTNGAIGNGATRTTATQIQNFLKDYLPPNSVLNTVSFAAPAPEPQTFSTEQQTLTMTEVPQPLAATTQTLTQNITATPSSQSITPGSSFAINANYSTSDNNKALISSFGFKLHYDSSKLQFVSGEVATTSIQAFVGTPEADTNNSDNDASTDKVINIAWLNIFSAAWPNVNLPVSLYQANFTTLSSFTSGNTRINFSSDNTSPGYTFQSTSATINATSVPTNSVPTGTVTITGTAREDQALTANNTLADADGLGAIAYTWKTGNTTLGTGSTYKLTQNEVGKTVTVTASYTDGKGKAESKTSAATSTITNVNDLPTGTVSISGTAKQGQILAASHSLADEDGLGTIAYTWKTGNTVLGTGETYKLTANEVGKTVTVTASYTDGYGTFESKTSAATNTVLAAVNHAPTGKVVINGNLAVGQFLVAANTLDDADGLGAFSYQWQSSTNGGLWDDIANAKSSVYILKDADLGKLLRVSTAYVDGSGTLEKVHSPSVALPYEIVGSNNKDKMFGTAAVDHLFGLNGNDVIDGSYGSDILEGGAGKDIFKFTVLDGIKTLNDFSVRDDTIQLENAVFSSLGKAGKLAANKFTIGSQAYDSNDYIIYDALTGAIYYDMDAIGSIEPVQIAVVGVNLPMTHADFVVI